MNIYVGNLEHLVTSDDLRELFAVNGEVASAQVSCDRSSGESKGFGFVEMPDAGQARAAIEALNGVLFKGRTLRCNEAIPISRGGRSSKHSSF